MAQDTDALRGQNATLVFAWGNVRVDLLKYRQRTRITETTGAGHGTDTQHVPGTRVRQFAASGIVITGVPDFVTEVGQIRIDLRGDNTEVVDAAFSVMTEQEFTVNFRQGGAIQYRCAATVDGAPTITGGP